MAITWPGKQPTGTTTLSLCPAGAATGVFVVVLVTILFPFTILVVVVVVTLKVCFFFFFVPPNPNKLSIDFAAEFKPPVISPLKVLLCFVATFPVILRIAPSIKTE